MAKAYFYKLFRSPLTYISVLGITGLCCTRFLEGQGQYWSVVYHVNLFLDLDAYRKVISVFAALPFAANFAEEWKEAVTVSCVTRRNVRKYALDNIVFCWVTSLLAVFLGIMLFAGVYSLFIPFYIYDPNPKFTPYGIFLDTGYPLLFLTARVFIFSASCAMWSVMGMLLSAIFPNKYIAICSPLVASYIIERFSMQLPTFFDLYALSLSYLDSGLNPALAFFYSLGVFAAISAICGLIFYHIVKRRVRCEIA